MEPVPRFKMAAKIQFICTTKGLSEFETVSNTPDVQNNQLKVVLRVLVTITSFSPK